MHIDFAKTFNNVIASKELGHEIYLELNKYIAANEFITIDLKDVDVMTSFCAKQIFGAIYLELGPELFYQKLKFLNTSSDLKIIISESIQSAVVEN